MKRPAMAGLVAGACAIALAIVAARAEAPGDGKAFDGFKPPAGLSLKDADAAYGWMMRKEAQTLLAEETLALGEAKAMLDSGLVRHVREALLTELASGYYATTQKNFVGDRLFEVGGSRLYSGDDVVFDAAEETGNPSATIDSWQASPSGERIAIAIADGGTETGTARLYNLRTGKLEPDIIGPTIKQGPISWVGDDVMLVATPRTLDFAGDDPSRGITYRVYRIGKGMDDTAVFAADETGAAPDPMHIPGFWGEPQNTSLLLASYWGGSYARYFWADRNAALSGQGKWRRIAADRQVVDAEAMGRKVIFVAVDPDGAQSLNVLDTATGGTRLLRKGGPSLVFEFSAVAGDGAFVRARSGAYHRLFYLDGRLKLHEVKLPFEGAIDDDSFAIVGKRTSEVVFELSRADQPAHFIRVKRDAVTAKFSASVRSESLLATGSMEVRLEYATSADGTKIPMTVMEANRRPDSPPARAIVNAYGSYGDVSMNDLDLRASAWVALGGVYANCHVRGGGYYGAAWYAAGKPPDKSLAHEDLIACGEHLVKTGRATPSSLAAQGASGGALIVGPVGFARPDLFHAIVLQSGFANPLRALDAVNGAAQLDEIGDPRIPEVAAKLAGSDTIEAIRKAKDAPAMFVCLGMEDDRVPYWMSTRAIALYQERFPDKPLGVSVDPDSGHSCFESIGAVEAFTRRYAWLWSVLTP